MTLHTAGPWFRDGYTVYALNDDRRPFNRFYATVQLGFLSNDLRTDERELEANAKLICAAPELLAALEESVSALAFMLDQELAGENRPEWVRVKRDRLDAARAAIAKATKS